MNSLFLSLLLRILWASFANHRLFAVKWYQVIEIMMVMTTTIHFCMHFAFGARFIQYSLLYNICKVIRVLLLQKSLKRNTNKCYMKYSVKCIAHSKITQFSFLPYIFKIVHSIEITSTAVTFFTFHRYMTDRKHKENKSGVNFDFLCSSLALNATPLIMEF